MSFGWMLLITLAVLQASVFITTIYLHRALSHRSLELNPVVSNLMHLELSLFTGIVPLEWVAVHRKHHHFTDKEGDPHSPYLFGMWRVLFAFGTLFRREIKNGETVRKYTPDYRPDFVDGIPGIRFGSLGGLAIFMLMFGWAWGLAAMVFHVAGYMLLMSSINSLAHMVGYRNWDNRATNLWSLALVTGGEGLHNNHHAYPCAAKFSMKAIEIDPAWLAIKVLERLGMARIRSEPIAAVRTGV